MIIEYAFHMSMLCQDPQEQTCFVIVSTDFFFLEGNAFEIMSFLQEPCVTEFIKN